VRLADGHVSFRWKDYAHSGRQRVMTLAVTEFMHRFLLHVLPTGFVKIRHYGFLANRFRTAKRELCRQLLGVPTDPSASTCEAEPTCAAPSTAAPCEPERCPRCRKDACASFFTSSPCDSA
jgi:hypothetical protein